MSFTLLLIVYGAACTFFLLQVLRARAGYEDELGFHDAQENRQEASSRLLAVKVTDKLVIGRELGDY